jgi:exo-1,4-beta-D-glucosaminidase
MKMIPADQLWPVSDAWSKHCTTSTTAMNTMDVLTNVMNNVYGTAADFNDYVRKGHALDYDGTRAMFESFRVNTPVTTGLIQWMLNSAWPSIYWQLYDYYGVPVAAYYGTKKACEPVQLIYNYKDSHVYLVNEGLLEGDVTVAAKVYDAASALLGEVSKNVATSYRNTVDAFDMTAYNGRPHFIALEVKDAEGNVLADNFYCIGAQRNVYDWDKSTWYDTPITSYSDLSFAFAQPAADVTKEVSYADGVYTVVLTNNSETISYMNILKAKNAEGELVVPAYWSDNFFPLLPGQTKTVTCKAAQEGLTIEL